MVKIRSSSPNVGVMIKENVGGYGADPGTWGSGSYRVPFISCTIKAEDEILPDSGEFTTLGAAQRPVRGRRLARGQIKVEPVYAGLWFWNLFGHGFGSEDIALDEDIEEVPETGLNTHGFDVQVIGASDLAMRIYKNAAFETYTGLVAQRWVWEHAVGAIPTVTMDMVGVAAINPITSSVADFIATLPTDDRVKLTDLGRSASNIFFGATQAGLNINAFRLIGERSIDADDPEFLQNLLTTSKPGQQDNRDVTIELEGTLEADYFAAGKPMTEYLADTLSKGSISYASAVVPVTSAPHQIRFDMPSISWTASVGDLDTLGQIPFSATGRCLSGALSGLLTAENFDSHLVMPLSGTTDLRCLMHIDGTIDGDAAITGLGVSA